MATLKYRYMMADGSLDAVAERFLTTTDAIRALTRNQGKVANIAFNIDDPKWGTRGIDYGRTLIVPLPVEDPAEQDSDDIPALRRWKKYQIPAGVKFNTYYQRLDQKEKRSSPYLLGEDKTAARQICENWRNHAFRRACLEANQDPYYGSAKNPQTVWIFGTGINTCFEVSAAPVYATSANQQNAFYLSLGHPVESLADDQLGPAHKAAEQVNDGARQAQIAKEVDRRIAMWLGGPAGGMVKGTWPGSPANVAVKPEVALNILDNMSRNDFAWKPEEGTVGKAAWFTSEGNPYPGTDASKSIALEVELDATRPRMKISAADLEKLYEQKLKEAGPTIEAQARARFKLDAGSKLTSEARKSLTRNLSKYAERLTWESIGKIASENPRAIVEVEVPQGRFSRSGSGKFAVVADRAAIRVKGGPGAVTAALERGGVKIEQPLMEAAEAAGKRLKWAGRVRGVFRYGGRILVVVAVAADVYKIYHARDHLKAVVECAGGWAGAGMAASGFAAWWTPADVAGPWAWLGHGVGTLIAGGVGYWVGSSVTREIYEFVVEDP